MKETDFDLDLPEPPRVCPPTAIPFTQFLRPNGRRADVWVTRPPEVVAQARATIARGYRFECEELMTGHVSLTIADPILEDDVAYEIVPNGPEVPDAVDRLVAKGALLPEPGTEPPDEDCGEPEPGWDPP